MNKELMARLILEKGCYVCKYYDVSVLTVLRNGLRMKKMTEGNAFKNISGYEYIGNAKEANAKSLPADLYLVLRPAFDKEGNQLDQSWYAVYRKRDSISSAFADYVLSIR